jgi:hypothetical protein
VLGQQKLKEIGEKTHAQKIIYKGRGGNVNAFQIEKTNALSKNLQTKDIQKMGEKIW